MSELAKGCVHFQEFKQVHGLRSFQIIYRYLVKPSPEARKLKVSLRIVVKAIFLMYHDS